MPFSNHLQSEKIFSQNGISTVKNIFLHGDHVSGFLHNFPMEAIKHSTIIGDRYILDEILLMLRKDGLDSGIYAWERVVLILLDGQTGDEDGNNLV